jgi:hypothetical protein
MRLVVEETGSERLIVGIEKEWIGEVATRRGCL